MIVMLCVRQMMPLYSENVMQNNSHTQQKILQIHRRYVCKYLIFLNSSYAVMYAVK